MRPQPTSSSPDMLTPITPPDAARYHADGYCVLEQFLSPHLLSTIRQQVDAAYQQAIDATIPMNGPALVLWRHESQGSRSIMPLANFPELDEFIRSPRVVDIAQRLTGATQLQLFEAIVFSKPPGKGDPFAWHNDASYYPFAPKKFVSFWVALDRCDHENGAMELAAGSHTYGDVDPVDLKTGRSLVSSAQGDGVLDPMREHFIVRQPALEAGDAVAFDGYTWHGSPPNRSGRIRRGLCFRFLTQQTAYAPFNGMGGTFIRQLNIAPGECIASPAFPVLWKRPDY